MRRLRSLIACLLLALWLPATLHCSLEQAGLLGEKDGCAEQCATDNCVVLERGFFKSAVVVVKAPAPSLAICLCCLIEIAPETIIAPLVSPAQTDTPPELARTWQFAVRAAPLPGAPSGVS
jgi:hypothetical protein